MDPIKVGFVGFGASTNCFHLPFLLPNKDLVPYAFLQRAPPSAPDLPFGHCTAKFPQARHYQTADAFFADPAIDVVVVATRDHAPFVRRALLAGKHAVVEKPFTPTSAAADELIALAKAQGKLLTVFQNRRLDSDFRTVQHLVAAGALGDITEAEIHFDPPRAPWTQAWTQPAYVPGLGNLFELGTHTIDQALCLFGRPASVTAFLRSLRGAASPIDDSFTLVLQYAGPRKDLLVTIKTSIVSPMRDQLRFLVRGTQGSFVKFGTCPQENRALAAPAQPADDPDYGTEDPRIWGTLTTRGPGLDPADAARRPRDPASGYCVGPYPSLPGCYRRYYENLVDAVRGTAPLAVRPEESRDGIRLIELARRSHDTGATVPWTDRD